MIYQQFSCENWCISVNSFPGPELQDILPGILNQLGSDNLDNLKKLVDQYQKKGTAGEGASATAQEEDDDEVPELVAGETFEAAAEEGRATAKEEDDDKVPELVAGDTSEAAAQGGRAAS